MSTPASTTSFFPLPPCSCAPRDLGQARRRSARRRGDRAATAVFRKVEELAVGDDREAFMRHLAVLGALVNRAIFEVCGVPENLATVI